MKKVISLWIVALMVFLCSCTEYNEPGPKSIEKRPYKPVIPYNK